MSNACGSVGSDERRCLEPAVGGSDYCRQHGDWFEADLRVFESIAEHFRQDIREFWNRSNLYLLVEGALASVFITTVTSGTADRAQLLLYLVLSIFGLGLTTVWYLVAKGSIAWIDRWRDQLLAIGLTVDRHEAYASVHSASRSAGAWQHPQQMTLYLIALFEFAWLTGSSVLLWILVTTQT